MGKVWERAIETVPKMILLKLADHANDQGGSIYPGKELLRQAVGLADAKTVQRRMAEFKALGVLVEEEHQVKVGRVYRKVWRIDLRALARHFPVSGPEVVPPNLKLLSEAFKGAPDDTLDGGEEACAATDDEDPRGGCQPPREETPDGGAVTAHEGAGEPPRHEGAGEPHGGAGESSTGGLGSPPNHQVTIKEPSTRATGARDAAPPGGDPDGPPDDAAQGMAEEAAAGETSTLAAEWRTLVPQIVAIIGESAFRFNLQDAFVAERRAIEHQETSPDGRLKFGDPQPAILLQLAVAEKDAVWRLSQQWRSAIFRATGYVLTAKVDPRALAVKARREEREKADREAAKAKTSSRRRG